MTVPSRLIHTLEIAINKKKILFKTFTKYLWEGTCFQVKLGTEASYQNKTFRIYIPVNGV